MYIAAIVPKQQFGKDGMDDIADEFEQITYQTPAPGIARIIMDRPERANAQGIVMTYELDAAIRRACHDDSVNAIILAGAGAHWNAGHDLSADGPRNPESAEVRSLWGDYGGKGWQGGYAREREIYLEITERWRNAPKPIIAEVQGAVISGGLMLAWMCDIIVCAHDARFRDATAVEMGIAGVELWQHPYEMPIRKAKQWLMTGSWIDAEQAEQLGMVNEVVPRESVEGRALEIASSIASRNPFTMQLVKQAMNFAQDQMGRKASVDFGFHLHQIGHMQALLTNGVAIDLDSLPPKMRATLEKNIAARKAVVEATG